MSSYKEGQTHQLANAMETAGYTPAEITTLGQNPELLAQIKLVLMGLATIVLQCFKLACTKTFNLTEFIGKDWTVWRGAPDSNGLKGEEDRDKHADALDVIDWEQALMENHLQEGETSIEGEEKLKRAYASGNIQLGVKQFLSLWEDYKANGKDSVLEKLRLRGVKRIYFFGTVLRYPNGNRCVLYLYLDGSEWYWNGRWLGLQWNADYPSVSLASVK